MKRIVTAILAGLLAVSGTAAVSAAAKVDGRATCEAYIADVTVDGKIDDVWKYAPNYDANFVKAFEASYYKDTMKAGVDYADMDVKVLWNGKNTLYVLAVVKDPKIHNNSTSQWLNDSVEMFLELNNANDSSKKPTQHRLGADGKQSGSTKSPFLSSAAAKTAHGWIGEFAYDVSAVGGAGQYLGIEFQYNDAILGDKKRQVCLGWGDKENKAFSDASKMGQCLLSSTKVADLKAAETTKAAETVKKPETPASPATFDASVLLAVAAAAAGTGTVIFRKKK